ncbi:aminotransferase class V-fold PLP-dependent enzyme [Paenibacillus sacheonensis]|uniref:cysteine desulfurase n=1 Tax=Paenibacillus sacheonensis TaxID=742054 RepID=A0A7X4YQS9_9BACL|nr:aminotransferase class V-fold PLP-dependent enzyme [Paenibacillus sacheonensis]MBM7567942.1 cysteine desulfurase family protein [Paenibacillus sacheonensis]NBC70827.1 aminotransferase class V-fold PLP-dependent enzyme [Paenibacillus sacheonensis]
MSDDKHDKPFIYLDHAATSWPKPATVIEAVTEAMERDGANPGRGSHAMAVRASRILFETRKSLAKLFVIKNPNDISFALNTTMALNTAIKGILKSGDHVIATAVEHNSVRRPLEYLKSIGVIEVTYVEPDEKGILDAKQVQTAIRSNTKLAVVNHSSNLLGSILPIGDIGEVTRHSGVKLLVDAAQSAGILDIDVEAMGVDMLAFPGHKGLLGPQGTGGLYIHPELDLEPLMHGGTGSQSESIEQPAVRPDRYEAGTQNTSGISGLRAGVKHVLHETVQNIHTKEWTLTQIMMQKLLESKGIRILGPALGEARTGIVSFIIEGADPSEIGFILDQHYNMAVRTGFHCSPLAHGTAGTLETGAIRASVGCFTTSQEVEAFAQAVKEIVQHYS